MESDRTHDPTSGNGTLVSSTVFLKEIETPDKYTLVLNFAQPWPGFFDVLETINIIDPQSSFKDKPVGSGPFMFVDYAPGDHLQMVKNKNYWQTGKPYVDEVLVKFYKDQQAMVAQLEGGAIDVVDSPPTPDAVRLQGDANYQVLSNQYTGTYVMIAANVRNAPFDNKIVRQALNYALDRKRIVATATVALASRECRLARVVTVVRPRAGERVRLQPGPNAQTAGASRSGGPRNGGA